MGGYLREAHLSSVRLRVARARRLRDHSFSSRLGPSRGAGARRRIVDAFARSWPDGSLCPALE